MITRTHTEADLFSRIHSVAQYSDCKTYRYFLSREWDESLPSIGFLMLNPSTATETQNDPTIHRCMERAKTWNYGKLVILNLFALRSTDPQALYTHPEPIGPRNDYILRNTNVDTLVCAWGTHGKLNGRANEVRTLLADRYLYHLSLTQCGEPGHPLYLPYHLAPQLLKRSVTPE